MVFLTGFSGRFPASRSVSEFWENLVEGKDLVSTTERYPGNYNGLPGRQAQVDTISKFDSMFFGISANQAACLDPQIRLLLESVYEAITDAGYTMEDLAGSNTGVYVGGCFSDLHKAMLKDIRTITGYENTGCSHSMFSNRVSFCFDFHGPSLTVDTACSSSLVAFDQAVRDIRSGKITRAIVGGVSIVMDPGISKSFHAYNMLSPDGKCHSFDTRANGYVRADGVGAVLLESKDLEGVSSGYMDVVGTGVNSDGWKSEGITYPSADQQISLCRSVIAEYGIQPERVKYVEAHGTGTTAGDRQELRAIDTVYGGKDGQSSTLIGSVKSNMGHAEGASGMMALVKVLSALAEDTVPGNLHFLETIHEPIVAGRLSVASATTPLQCEGSTEESGAPLVVINNFGFGGTNAHVVGSKAFKRSEQTSFSAEDSTRWVYGRTKECLQGYVDNDDLNLTAWSKMMRSSKQVDKFPWRGVVETSSAEVEGGGLQKKSTLVSASQAPSDKVHVAFCYSGQGCQWEGMAKDLWEENQIFRDTIIDACEGLEGLSVSPEELFTRGDQWMTKKWSGFGITLVQLGLTAVLTTEHHIKPDFIFGHSVGEVACGYADGCTSAKEAARIALVRCSLSGKITADGLMLAAGVGYDDAVALLAEFPETVIACYNSPDGVTLSGPAADITALEAELKSKDIFARLVPTDGVAYHSSFFKKHIDQIREVLGEAITDEPVKRSERWLSTSSTDDADNCFSDASYHAFNVAGMVNFAPVVASLPPGTQVLEIGPSSILKSMIKRSNSEVVPVSVMLKGQPGTSSLRSAADAVWLSGAQQLEFPRLTHIVPPSKRIQVLWDHEKDWRVCDYKDFATGKNDSTVTYDLMSKDSYMLDHFIDGRALFPAMGHIYTAWQASPGGLHAPFHCKNIKILRAIILDGCSEVTFRVSVAGSSWTILHDDQPCCTGEYAVIEAEGQEGLYMPCTPGAVQEAEDPSLTSDRTEGKEMYASLFRYGYEYKKDFRLVESLYTCSEEAVDTDSLTDSLAATTISDDSSDTKCTSPSDETQYSMYSMSDTEHWTAYLDNVLQAAVSLSAPVAGLCLPTQIEEVVIKNPNVGAAENNLVMGRPHLNVVGNENVTIRGLQTTLSRKMHKSAIVNGLEFVSYGEHVYSFEENYKAEMLKLLTNQFWKIFHQNKETIEEYPFLSRIAAIAPSEDTSLTASAEPQHSCSTNYLETVTQHVYGDSKEQRAATLKNAYLEISLAPGHDELYAFDPSSSCVGAVDANGLSVMVQIMRNNIIGPTSKLSVVELGAGSGGLTRNLFPLVQADIESYTATDISNIKEYFPNTTQCARYDLNDSWTGAKVNLVAASNALHTGSNLRKCLKNISDNMLVADGGGYLLLHEYISVIPVLLWGLNDFAWSAEDGDERDFALWTTKEKWLALLSEAGLEPVTWYVDKCEHQMLMLARKIAVPQEEEAGAYPIVSSISQLQNVAASLEGAAMECTLQTTEFADLAFMKSLRKEPSFYGCRIELQLDEQEGDGVGYGSSLPVAVRSGGRWGGFHEVPFRFTPSAPSGIQQEVFGMHSQIAQPGNIDSMHWVQNTQPSNVQVAFCGLNFKDAMLAYGRLITGGKEVPLGLEFSGTRMSSAPEQDGTPCMGISTGCMASSLCASEALIWDLPSNERLSLEAAATIPVVYSTVYYALICKANIQKGQTVLIHSIAGGVGQAAYHICRFRGVNVLVSCSKEKADWVHKNLGIDRSHIMDSHSLKFKDDVMELTKGQGVDVVLNSLSGEKLQMSLACLASYGHFCEIGKYDIQQNTKVGLAVFERNISLHCIDLSDMFDKPRVWDPVYALVKEGLESGEIIPLCTTVFDDVESGLRCISAGKHIGKILVDMEKAAPARGPCPEDDEALSVPPMDNRFRTSGTHIVVGGLGGFGLEVVKFLAAHGAEAIVVISRGEPKAWQARALRDANAIVLHHNLLQQDQCDQLVQAVSTDVTPGLPLVGVWHLGMVLNDRLYSNMTPDAWKTTVAVKGDLCHNLDQSTRKFAPSLEHFVMWSSVSSLFGNAGQTNYSYGNAVMEELCMKRKSEGLCGTAVQWGLIGGVGVMVDKINNGTKEEFAFVAQHIDSCLDALESTLLFSQHAVVTSYIRTDASSNAALLNSKDGAKEMTVSQRVARVLGVDTSKIRDTDTLAALGMDSLQSVEVIGILKKAQGVVKTQAELQALPWAALEAGGV